MGPVFISLPMDDWAVDLDETKAAELRAVARRKVTHGGALAPVVAASIAEQLARSERPALVVGGDVERAGAWDAMVSLAEHCRAPVWTAPFPGLRGFPEDHPLYQGELLPDALWVAMALVELVLPAEPVDHLRHRPALVRVPLVVGELQVPDLNRSQRLTIPISLTSGSTTGSRMGAGCSSATPPGVSRPAGS